MKRLRLNSPQIVSIGFMAVIICGALLLNLPVSAQDGVSAGLIDSLFTATSATCVTGLTVKDIGKFFSPFGKLIVLFLMQIGGLGIMTFSTMFAILLGKKLNLSQNIIVQDALDRGTAEGLRWLIVYIIIFTISIEGLGALILYLRWLPLGWGHIATIKKAVFHSVSAFCNAGLGLFSDSLASFRSDWVVIATISALIVIGGIGFVVFLDVSKIRLWKKNRRLMLAQVSLQTKLAVLITAFLIIGAALLILFFENNNMLKGMSNKEKIWSSIFTSVTPRTAGFEVFATGGLRPITLFLLIILMFIGASPGGTGGGIKTVTFGIILVSAYSMFYNKDRICIFGRTIPRQTYRKAIVVTFLSFLVVLASTFLLSITESITYNNSYYFLSVLFESTSAFGTVGLSMGITPNLTSIGKLIIICVMFIGRVGPLTLALAVALRKEKTTYNYPEERLMVG